jgi:hypothetical protein
MPSWQITGTPVPITFEAGSFETACVAVLVAGEGAYGVRELDGHEREMPIFWLRCEADLWIRSNLGKTVEQFLDGINKPAVVAALASFTIHRPAIHLCWRAHRFAESISRRQIAKQATGKEQTQWRH